MWSSISEGGAQLSCSAGAFARAGSASLRYTVGREGGAWGNVAQVSRRESPGTTASPSTRATYWLRKEGPELNGLAAEASGYPSLPAISPRPGPTRKSKTRYSERRKKIKDTNSNLFHSS